MKFAGERTEKSENSESRVALRKLTRPSDTVGIATMLSGTIYFCIHLAQAFGSALFAFGA